MLFEAGKLHEEAGGRCVDGAGTCAIGFGLAEGIVAAGVFDCVVEVRPDVIAQGSLIFPQRYGNSRFIHRAGGVAGVAVVASPLAEHLELEKACHYWGGKFEQILVRVNDEEQEFMRIGLCAGEEPGVLFLLWTESPHGEVELAEADLRVFTVAGARGAGEVVEVAGEAAGAVVVSAGSGVEFLDLLQPVGEDGEVEKGLKD